MMEEVLAVVGISFFSVYLNALFCFVVGGFVFCFLILHQFRTPVLGLITLIQRGDSSEEHCFYYNSTVVLLLISFFAFYGIVLVFNSPRDVKTVQT